MLLFPQLSESIFTASAEDPVIDSVSLREISINSLFSGPSLCTHERPHASRWRICSVQMPSPSIHPATSLHSRKVLAFHLGKTLCFSGKFLSAFLPSSHLWNSFSVWLLKIQDGVGRQVLTRSVTEDTITRAPTWSLKSMDSQLGFSLYLPMVDSSLSHCSPNEEHNHGSPLLSK